MQEGLGLQGSIAVPVVYNPQYLLNRLSTPPGRCARISNFFCCRTSLSQMIQRLSNEHLNVLFQAVAKDSFEGRNPELMQRAISCISLNRFLEAVALRDDRLELMIKRMKACDKELHRSAAYIAKHPTWEQKHSYLVRKLYALFETLLSTYSFVAVGTQPTSGWEASHVWTAYGKLFALPFLLITVFNSLLASPMTAVLVTALSIATFAGLLFVYIKWLRPPAEEMYGIPNLTYAAQQGHLTTVLGRDDEIDMALFYVNSGLGTILKGEPGAGKTVIMGAVAQRINDGDTPLFPDTQVYAGNVSHLVGNSFSSDSTDSLKHFGKRIDGEHVVVGLDEVHGLLKPGSKVKELFKSYTDRSLGRFSHYMAATTNEDFDRYIASDPAILRRFPGVVSVSSTPQEKTGMILRDLHSKEASDVEVDEKLLSEIVSASSTVGGAQPDTAISVFLLAVAEARRMQWHTKERQELQEKRLDYQNKLDAYSKTPLDETQGRVLDTAIAGIAALEEQLRTQKEIFARRMALSQAKAGAISEACYLSGKILSLPEGDQKNSLKKRFAFLLYFTQPYIETQLTRISLPPPKITKDSVDAIIASMKKLRKVELVIPAEKQQEKKEGDSKSKAAS